MILLKTSDPNGERKYGKHHAKAGGLIQHLLRYSNPKDTVLDPFMEAVQLEWSQKN